MNIVEYSFVGSHVKVYTDDPDYPEFAFLADEFSDVNALEYAMLKHVQKVEKRLSNKKSKKLLADLKAKGFKKKEKVVEVLPVA